MGRKSRKRRRDARLLEARSFRLADEVRYMQQRAAAHDARMVTVGAFVLFSTATGDAWLLDPSDGLAACLARDGDPIPVQIAETATQLAVAWPGSYRLDGPAFVYQDRDTGRVTAILGYPTQQIAQAG